MVSVGKLAGFLGSGRPIGGVRGFLGWWKERGEEEGQRAQRRRGGNPTGREGTRGGRERSRGVCAVESLPFV